MKSDFTVKTYLGGNLFKQGTEIVAMQRGNLGDGQHRSCRTSRTRFRRGRSSPRPICSAMPITSRRCSPSDVGAQLKKMAEDQLGIHILGPTYFGARQVGLKPNKKINTPADMAGIKLRMPGGDAWQFLGQSIGANPTPMAYAEVYTGLQTGAIDGQDNPLPNVQNMKFYEVMSQIALTSHLIGFDLLCVIQQGGTSMSAAEAGSLPGRRRQGDRVEHAGPSARPSRSSSTSSRSRGLEVYTPGPQGLPRVRAEEVSRLRSRQELAGRHGRQDQRDVGTLSPSAADTAAGGSCFRREPDLEHSPGLSSVAARRAENIGVVMMAVMFLAFIVQIGFRYLLNFPIGWTSELTIIMWLWLVLLGASFIVREREEIRFDLIYSTCRPAKPAT